MSLQWQNKKFAELSPTELYALLKLRQDIFIVEQNCPYPDADGLDPQALHLMGWRASELLVYMRIFAPGIKYPEASLGRIVSAQSVRGTGLGKRLMERGLQYADRAYSAPIRISAQAHLHRFYRGFGFERASEPYDEDGILHIDMLRPAQTHALP